MEFIWAFLYYLTHQTAVKLAAATNLQWIHTLAITLYAVVLLVWINRSGQAGTIGLCRIKQNCTRLWEMVFFLLIFPVYNLFSAAYWEKDLLVVVATFFACLIEEIFFRGFLLQYLKRYGTKTCVLISSSLFALYHLGNLFVIEEVGFVLLQSAAAFSAGVCYAVAAILLDSLLPCVAAHFLVNITAAPAMETRTEALWMCIVMSCFCYYHFLGKKQRIVN